MTEGRTFESNRRLWVIHIGNDDRIAIRARDEGFVCIGWTVLGDLTLLDTREKMRSALEAASPSATRKSISSQYGQPFRFAHEIQIGDPLVFPIKPTSEIAIGRVAGPYEWAESDPDLREHDYCNIRRVTWIKIVPRTIFSQPALHSFGSFLSVSTSDDYLEEVQAVLRGDTTARPEPDPTESETFYDVESTADLYQTASQETEDYLLKSWRRTGSSFEGVVAAVFEAMGYTAKVTPPSGDHGIDVIAHPDPLGMEPPTIKIQVKSGDGSVGEPEVNQLRGILNAGEKGIVVSLGRFTSGAEAVARQSADIKLIERKEFIQLFLDHYDSLKSEWRSKFPMKRVFVPFR